MALALLGGLARGEETPKRTFTGTFTWTQEVIVLPTATAGKHELTAILKVQVCNDGPGGSCYPGYYAPLTFPVEIVGTASELPPGEKKIVEDAVAQRAKEKAPSVDIKSLSTKKLLEIIDFKLSVGPDDPFAVEYKRDAPAPPLLKVRPGQKLYATIQGRPKSGYYTYSITESTTRVMIGDGKTFVGVGPIREAPEPELHGATPEVATGRGDKTRGKGNPGGVDTNDFWGLMVAAFFGGFFMLLTPCVFPMIPITVNFFLKQSEKEHHRPLFLASVYSGTIVLLLTMTMLLFGNVVITLANNAWFNLILGGALVFFALSLFGMYEIELPSFLARFTSAREGQGGVIGAFFMALTFTITSFTCTGPFIGIFLTPVALQKPPFLNLVAAAVVYSATFAAPFFFLALFPTLLRKMPKSGGWLNTVKVTMGFIEVAAALKFLANADYTFFPGQPRVFTFDAVLCAWIALSLATGLYLFGLFRLPHDDAVEHVGVLRMMFGTIFIGLSLYMTPLLFGIRPTGAVGEGIVAFLPPRLGESPLAFGGGGKENLKWHSNYAEAWALAKKENKLLFIDFTGVNCPNCRYNELNVFPNKDVQKTLQNYVLVQLYVDIVPDRSLSKAQAEELAEQYARWRDDLGKTSALPTYVVVKPDSSGVFKEGAVNGTPIDNRSGVVEVKDFLAFISQPLEGKVAAPRWHSDYATAWKRAKEEKKDIFINFSGVNNVNCRFNEEQVFSRPEVIAALKKYVLLELFCDSVPDKALTFEEAGMLGERNAEWREQLTQRFSVPTYVVLRPNSAMPFKKSTMAGAVLDTRDGVINDTADFVRFLEHPEKRAASVRRTELLCRRSDPLPAPPTLAPPALLSRLLAAE